jgi:predicted RNase H-like nuclease (RuvC/YqgF family)
MKLTEETARALQVSRLTVDAMRTPAVMVVDSGRVQKLQARIAELEQQVTEAQAKAQKLEARAKAQAKAQRAKAQKAKEAEAAQELVNRRVRLEEATIKQGGRSYAPEHEVPMLSMMGLTRPSALIGSRKPSLIQRLMFWRR